jgi:hypothetical protein
MKARRQKDDMFTVLWPPKLPFKNDREKEPKKFKNKMTEKLRHG